MWRYAPLLATTACFAANVEEVFIAQKHVQPITSEYLRLIGELEALVKVHVTKEPNEPEPVVSVTAISQGNRREIPVLLPGCSVSCTCKEDLEVRCSATPSSFPSGPGQVVHEDEDLSYKALIKPEWVVPGDMQIEVKMGEDEALTYDVVVGAPSDLTLLTFDLLYFGRGTGSFTDNEDWVEEFGNRFPVKKLNQFRVRNVNLQSMIVPPRGGFPATLVHSQAHYRVKNGDNFDGEQATALSITGAIRNAGKLKGPYLTYSYIFGVHAGGQAGGYSGVGSAGSPGVTLHELGHALDLPHWGGIAQYPYTGNMHGIMAPDTYGGDLGAPHVGPSWGYDNTKRSFISPITEEGNVDGKPVGTWKADPMQGGGSGWQLPGSSTTMFSDYSNSVMQKAVERNLVVQKSDGEWYRWDSENHEYVDKRPKNNYPAKTATVMTLFLSLARTDGKTIAWVYEPFGPYQGAFNGFYDPTDAADRERATADNYRGDYTIKLWIGGKVKHYLLNVAHSEDFHAVWAVNLELSEGNIDKGELLYTPQAHTNGVPANADVVFTYRGEYLLGDARGGPCPEGYDAVTNTNQCQAGVAAIGELLEYNAGSNQANGLCTWCGQENTAYVRSNDAVDACGERRFVCKRTAPVGSVKKSVDCEGSFRTCDDNKARYTVTRKKFGAGKDCEATHEEERDTLCTQQPFMGGTLYRAFGGDNCPEADRVTLEMCKTIAGDKFRGENNESSRPVGCFRDTNGGDFRYNNVAVADQTILWGGSLAQCLKVGGGEPSYPNQAAAAGPECPSYCTSAGHRNTAGSLAVLMAVVLLSTLM